MTPKETKRLKETMSTVHRVLMTEGKLRRAEKLKRSKIDK